MKGPEAMFKKYELFERISGKELIQEMGFSPSRLHDLVFNHGLTPYEPNDGPELLDLRLQGAIREIALSRALGKNENDMLLLSDYKIEDLKRILEPHSKVKKPLVTKKHVSRQHQQAKERCREIAKQILKENPRIDTVKEAIFDDRMTEAATKTDGDMYAERVIHDWIKDLFPKKARRPGKRPKK